MSQARSPRQFADQFARDAVERHWAVKAVPVATRRHARVAADRAWEALEATLPSRDRGARLADAASLGRRLTRSEAQEIATVADAYERAADEARQALLAEGLADGGEARAIMRVAAAECFRLRRVLHADVDRDAAWAVVGVSALGVLGDVGPELRTWSEHAAALIDADATLETPTAVLEQQPWDEALRQVLPAIWLALLRPASGDATDQAFDALGRLREMRVDAEARRIADLSATDAAHMQLTLAGLYGVAEAAATLVTQVRRTAHADVAARLANAFVAARAAVPTASPLGRVLPWLHVAAVTIARRQSAQIALPGLLT